MNRKLGTRSTQADHFTADKYLPTRLCEVLEKEFVAAHGPLSSPRNWLLERDDISFAALLDHLRVTSESATSGIVGAIRERLQNDGFVIPTDQRWSPEIEQRVVQALNNALCAQEFLYDPRLLAPDTEARQLVEVWTGREEPFRRHAHATPSDSERAESSAVEKHGKLLPADDEHVLLNRLLLEAAFPPATVARVDTRRLELLFEDISQLRGPGGIYSALCLSGGGIRSAAFSLGIVQGLAKYGLLDRFDFLSTVSGGGYLGSWLSTWVHRHPQGLGGVVRELSTSAQTEAGNLTPKVEPSPAPVAFLRNYSYFLNPRAGLFTVDTWTWIGIYLRNLSLNWLVLIPLLLLLLALPRLYAAALYSWRVTHGNDVPILAPGDLFPLFGWIATFAAVASLICVTVNRPSASDPAPSSIDHAEPRSYRRQHFIARFKSQPWLLGIGVLPMVGFGILMTILVWGLPKEQAALSLNQVWSYLNGVPLDQLPAALVYVGFEHLWIWGELVVLIAWLVAVALLPARDWRKLLRELLIMLAAGLLTWAMVAGLAGFSSRIGTNPKPISTIWSTEVYRVHLYAVLAVPTVILTILAGMTLFIGAVSKANWIEDEDREWWARFGSWVLVALVAWCALNAVTIFGPPLLLEFPRALAAVGGVSGLIAVLLGRSSHTLATSEKNTGPTTQRKGGSRILGVSALPLVAAVFLVVFLAFLSLVSSAMLKALLDWLTTTPEQTTNALGYILRDMFAEVRGGAIQACGAPLASPVSSAAGAFSDPEVHLDLICGAPFTFIWKTMLVPAAIFGIASLLINLNKFSLHAAYRIRIVRTFLGASRGEQRQPNPFTGFDPLDDVQMHELLPGLIRETDIANLAQLVRRLRGGLLAKEQSAVSDVARLMCAWRHDPIGLLSGVRRHGRAHRIMKWAPRSAQRMLYRLLEHAQPNHQSGVLAGRLRAYVPGKPVLKSLEQDVLEALNRLLQSSRLNGCDAFRRLIGQDAETKAIGAKADQYFRQGNIIFGNRLLLQLAFPEEIRKYDFPPPPPHKLLHVVNLTLNIVRGAKLAWQERKAAPFVVTPMFAGSYYLGYRRVRDYGGKEGISVGTAVAISGAAVSPNMGYSSSPLLALLLTIFNVRLGWWLGNPGIAGAKTYGRAEPKFSARPVISEALGLTDDQSPYVYLSDGGHFDNMGLFEMVLRRCQLIICTDAGADPEYEFADLGNAVRKIRIDLGIPIEFDAMPIHRPKTSEDKTVRYCALGRIRYSYVDGAGSPDGVLICFKPVLSGNEPQDVLNYAARSKIFPQEPTLDQFFGESQFESYRQLGQHAVQTVFADNGFVNQHEGWGYWVVKTASDYIGAPLVEKPWLANWLADITRRVNEDTAAKRTRKRRGREETRIGSVPVSASQEKSFPV